MNEFCDWLSETKVISVHDSFFWEMISIVYCLLSTIHKACSYKYTIRRILLMLLSENTYSLDNSLPFAKVNQSSFAL